MKLRSTSSRGSRAPIHLALLALCAGAHAQLPSTASDLEGLDDSRAPSATGDLATNATRLAIDEDRLYWDVLPDGVVWTMGNGFKASFSTEGASITPFLGSDAPQNYPVTFSLERASVGGVAIDVEHGVQALHEGANVRFERGAIVETYDLDARSIEQSFDLHAPVGSGDLALRIAFESELVAQQVNDGIVFRNERGGLDYSHAVAIDANGEQVEMPALLVDGAIEIVVPAEFLASAAYPVRVDPTVTVSGVDVSSEVHVAPDVAYTFHSSDAMVAFERVFSAADSDIAVAAVSSSGAVLGATYVDITNDRWTSPSLASVRSQLRYLVAAARVAAGGGESRVWGRTVNSSASPVSAQFQISGSEGGDVADVQVGGSRVEDPNAKFLVAWSRQANATQRRWLRRVIDATAAPATGAIEHTTSLSDAKPRVSQAAENGEWTVVWEREVAAGNRDILIGRVQADASMSGFPLVSTPADEFNPDVSSRIVGSDHSMVTYQTLTGGNNGDIRALVLNGLTTVATFFASSIDGSFAFDTVDASVETDGSHFLIAYTRANDQRLRLSEYYLLDTLPVQFGLLHAEYVDVGMTGRAALSSRYAAGSTSRRQAIVWSRGNDLWIARVDDTAGGRIDPLCFGDGSGVACPCANSGGAGRGCANSVNANGASLSGSGNALIGGDSVVLTGDGMPSGTSCLYFQGTSFAAPATVFGDGLRCLNGTIVRLGTKANDATGASSYPGPGDQDVSVRGAVPATGGIRGYQLWYRNAADFCTTSTFNLSNALQIVFTP